MKRHLIWLLGGSVSRHWSMPLIGQFSEHNFRRVERDISCLCKLFLGILFLYINSKSSGQPSDSLAVCSVAASKYLAILFAASHTYILQNISSVFSSDYIVSSFDYFVSDQDSVHINIRIHLFCICFFVCLFIFSAVCNSITIATDGELTLSVSYLFGR